MEVLVPVIELRDHAAMNCDASCVNCGCDNQCHCDDFCKLLS